MEIETLNPLWNNSVLGWGGGGAFEKNVVKVLSIRTSQKKKMRLVGPIENSCRRYLKYCTNDRFGLIPFPNGKFDKKYQKVLQTDRKHIGKRKDCSL